MRTFSKSKLLALRQCPKRLWLEVHHPELREVSAATEVSFQVGFKVGDIARRIYDPEELGALIDVAKEGFGGAFKRSTELLGTSQPIFEAGFSAGRALQMQSAPNLKSVDVGQGTKLQHLSLIEAPCVVTLDISGCKKLPSVAASLKYCS